MTLLLVLEHHFFRDTQGKVWCDRIVNYDYLKRYLLSFEEVIVCARIQNVNIADKSWQVASGPHISFQSMKNFKGTRECLKNVLNIRKAIKQVLNKADACILRTPSPISILAYPVIKHSGKPFALEMVMAADHMFNSPGFVTKICNYLIHIYVKRMCQEAAGVAYVTSHILQQKYPSQGFTASYSSIDLKEEYYCTPSWKEKPSSFTLVHTGYMDGNRKGQHILIQATALLLQQGYPVQTVLIGDGPFRTRFEQLAQQLEIQQKVVFTGAINDKNSLLNIFKKAHIFILPSKSEGLPRAILEAMAAGLPCVASDVDGIPELLEKNYLVHGFAPQDYADCIAKLLNNWEEMKRQSVHNLEIAKRYKSSILNGKRKKFYHKLFAIAQHNNL